MNILDELKALWRQFPNSRELAVSPEMVERFEREIVANQRFLSMDDYKPFVFVTEHYPAIKATKLPLVYRDRRLTLVESR